MYQIHKEQMHPGSGPSFENSVVTSKVRFVSTSNGGAARFCLFEVGCTNSTCGGFFPDFCLLCGTNSRGACFGFFEVGCINLTCGALLRDFNLLCGTTV